MNSNQLVIWIVGVGFVTLTIGGLWMFGVFGFRRVKRSSRPVPNKPSGRLYDSVDDLMVGEGMSQELIDKVRAMASDDTV